MATDSEPTKRRYYLLYVATAAYVFVDLMLLVPLVFVALQWPDLIWLALAPYLIVTLVGLGLLGYAGYRLAFSTSTTWR